MLNALEGQRPNPRARPPHMTGAGLFARPTVVNNVETLHGRARHRAARRGLVARASALTDEGGTKIFGVAGRVASARAAGSCPMGTPMRELIEVHAGGMLPGYALRAVSPGGASTAFVPAEQTRRAPRTSSTMDEVEQPPRHRHAGPARRPDLPRRHGRST